MALEKFSKENCRGNSKVTCADFEYLKNETKNYFVCVFEVKETTSQYRGVFYHKQTRKWGALVSLKGQKKMYGGIFKYELDAAKRVNEICEELGTPRQNPKICTITNLQYLVTF